MEQLQPPGIESNPYLKEDERFQLETGVLRDEEDHGGMQGEMRDCHRRAN